LENLRRHVDNLRTHFGFPCVVALNRFNSAPPPGELALVTAAAEKYGIQIVPATHWADGGQGAVPLAEAVVDAIENSPCNFRYLYPDEMPLWEKSEPSRPKSMVPVPSPETPRLSAKSQSWKPRALVTCRSVSPKPSSPSQPTPLP